MPIRQFKLRVAHSSVALSFAMPATAGRVKMPANNRVSSSVALRTTDVWSKTIGYDPYAGAHPIDIRFARSICMAWRSCPPDFSVVIIIHYPHARRRRRRRREKRGARVL
jgi:hypothetical protein